MMSEFFSSGIALQLAILFVAVEGVALFLWSRFKRSSYDVAGVLINLCSGALLMGAVYCALVKAPWEWLAMCLLASFAAHILDLRRRLRSNEQSNRPRGPILSNEAVDVCGF
jgi:hypothetical protein